MKRARHSSYHTGTRVSGPPSPVSPGARFTKYLTATLRYDKAKVTIDLRRTSNLQNMLRKTQGFPVPILRFKVRSTDAAGSRGRAPGQGVRGAKPPEAESLLAFQRPITARKITSFTVSSKLRVCDVSSTNLPSVLATVFKHGLPNLQARISNLQPRPCL